MVKAVIRYAVVNRYGGQQEFSSRREAEKAAKDERRDGWPCAVRDMVADGTTEVLP